MLNKILIPLDGSKLAEQVLPHAIELALRCQSRVVLLQVVPLTDPMLARPEFGVTLEGQTHWEEVMRLEDESAQTYLQWTAQPLRGKGLEVECVTLRGLPVERIISYSRQNGVDLIAIATHGRSGLGRLVFGSVADRVLKESGLPVLLIKPAVSDGK